MDVFVILLSQVDYFNNKVICDLVEMPHQGILAMLDEACYTVGRITDATFLDAMSTKLAEHKHFTCRKVIIYLEVLGSFIVAVSKCAIGPATLPVFLKKFFLVWGLF